MILRNLHEISMAAHRIKDGWCLITCNNEITASNVTKCLIDLGYEVRVVENENICPRCGSDLVETQEKEAN